MSRKLSRASRIAIIVVAAPIALVALASVVFALDRMSNGGEVLGGISVGGVELTGLSENQARRALQDLEAEMAAVPLVFEVQGTRLEILPTAVGFDLDEEGLLAEAMQQGRAGGLGGQFRWWLSHMGNRGDARLELAGTWNPELLLGYLGTWEQEAIADPPFEGGITVQNGAVVPLNPEPGTGIDREATVALVDAVMLDLSREPIVVPTALVSPKLSLAQVGTAVARAENLISEAVVLSRLNPDVQVRFPPEVLAAALRSEVVGPPDAPEIELSFALDPLVEFLDPQRAEIEFQPVDAEIVIRQAPGDIGVEPAEQWGMPAIIPSRTGLLIDEEALPAAIQAAATARSRTGPFPYKEGAPPDLSTEDAEALGIRELISDHDGDVCCTTFFTPGGDEKNLNRIHNIHLMADLINGTIVLPGESFSINDFVGPRTEEKGFRRAGAIIGPIIDCCDSPANWGGGVSQFATTMFNAIFWSGLEDVEHTPHTLYISRYPEGIEATLGWPGPDLVFRNNTDSAVYIWTGHTDDSVTVKLYGDTGGIEVAAERSERRNYTEPFDYFDPDPDIAPGEQDVTSQGTQGWTITVYRIITFPDGSETTESWMWRYHPWPRRVSVHPCELPEDHPEYDPNIQCPSLVPDLFGIGPSQAANRLAAVNLILVNAGTEPTNNPDLDGKIVRQSPGPGSLADRNAEVQVWYGEYSGGDGG
ncbi:MAG: VanW family protein [Acidimicrobiia bacterium]|nr:VanW family protein [Acidimicrobiia bacterium]